MDYLKTVIYLDLEKHFDRKVSHDQLFNCLVYDFLFVHLVIGPLFILTWRGAWQNIDVLYDQILFKSDIETSTICALILGIAG